MTTPTREPYVKAYMNPKTNKMEYRSVGDAVKAKGKRRIAGYGVRFTSEDDTDLHGEYFDQRTYFWEKERPIKGLPVLIDHAFDSVFKGLPVGIVDFVDINNVGVWIEAKLNEREDYLEYLEHMRSKGVINIDKELLPRLADNIVKAVDLFFETGEAHWSSGSHSQLVEIENKHIKSWPFIEFTGVMSPAEEEGTEINLKGAFELLDGILNSIPTAKAAKEANQEPKESGADSVEVGEPKPQLDNDIRHHEDKNMVKTKMDDLPEEQKETTVSDELRALVARMVSDEVNRMLGEGEEVEPEELIDAVAADFPDEEKMEGLDDEEKAKAFAEKMWGYVNEKIEKRQKALDAVNKVNKRHLNNAPTPDSNFLPGTSKSQTPRFSVSENLKYAHLSAMDMAMAWKMATASDKRPRGLEGRKATDFVSEEFYRHAVHKMFEATKDAKFSRPEDALFVKSVTPFKANELDATDITGQGLEYLGNVYDTMVWETARNNQIYQLMLNRGMLEKPVPQGMRSTVVPVEGNDPTVYGGVEGNSTDATGRPEVVYKITPQTTSTVTVTPGTFRTATAYTFELGEDSFVDMAAEANRKVRLALEEHIEKAMINGDTETAASTNINDIAGTPTATGLTRDYFLEFNGIRKSPLVTSTAYSRDGGTLAVDDYRRTWALLGSAQAPRKDNIFFLIDFSTFNASLDLLPVLTKDVAGEQNSLFTGNFDALWGIPVYMSGFLGLSNTAGKIDLDTPGNNTKGQILAVYAPYWAFVFKRNISIEMQRSPESESFEFYGSMRFALQRRSASAAAISYNLTV